MNQPIGTRFESEVGRVVADLEVTIQKRIDQVERDSRSLIGKAKGSPERQSAIRSEAQGTMDALVWVLDHLPQLPPASGDRRAS